MERLELMVCPVKECGAWWVRHGGWGRHCEHGQQPVTYVPEWLAKKVADERLTGDRS